MKKSSLLALAAFSLFAYPMFADETEETTEEPVAVETISTELSLNDEETQENFISCSCGTDEEEGASSYLACSNDEEEENTASA